jgi:uncharacterized protein (TIGR00730 family)
VARQGIALELSKKEDAMKISGELQINAIVGPTGSGKSALADFIYPNRRAPVIVIDRIQCFSDIPITSIRSFVADGVPRYYLSDRTISDGDYSAEEAFPDLLRLIDKLAGGHNLITMEGGSISLLDKLAHYGELPFRLSIDVMPLGERVQHWRRLRSRAVKMLRPDDGRAGILQEISQAWRHEKQRPFIASIVGPEAVLAWCGRNGVDPAEVGERPLTEHAFGELAAEIATAHMDYSLKQEAAMRDFFGESKNCRFLKFPAGSTPQSTSSEAKPGRKAVQTERRDRTLRVAVFCGSRPGALPVYAEAAEQLGRSLAAAGMELVYGGGAIGLMGVLANAVLDSGGTVHGVIPRSLVDCELAHSGLTTLHVTETMHERKALIAQLADAFIALPGGIGTTEELLEQLTWGQLGMHSKPCALLNVEGFFTPLTRLLDHFVTTHFMSAIDAEQVIVDSSSSSVVRLIQQTIARYERHTANTVYF